ncbi:MAG TPA: hypothetical protein VLS27_14365 [Gammaproteobacteria bacterium]|nr:hypothetical protein [Gammaproteobacteria bacterium]
MTENKRPWSPPQIIWSALIATVLWTAVGFSWFGHGFNWTTQGSAARMSENAVAESLATICAAQARRSPDAEANIQELSGLSTWKQGEFVEKANWANIPGIESGRSEIAELCATKLSKT